MKTSTLIIIKVLLEIILNEVYGTIVNVLLKLHSNSCCGNIYLSDDLFWVIILIQFEVSSQLLPSYRRGPAQDPPYDLILSFFGSGLCDSLAGSLLGGVVPIPEQRLWGH